MEVAPVLGPDDGLVLPAGVGAGERELQTLGEGRLAGAVAPGDDGQAGPGLQRQRHLRADAPEALDSDLSEVGAGSLGSSIGAVRDSTSSWRVVPPPRTSDRSSEDSSAARTTSRAWPL